MSTLAEKFTQLKDIKADIKLSLEERGLTPDEQFDTYADLVRAIPGTDEIKTALDLINEESGGANIQDSLDLVEDNYGAIKDALTAKGVDMAGVKPSGYDAKIAEAVAKATSEALFDFRPDTKTLLPYCYNSYLGSTDVVIPSTIGGVAVEVIAPSAFAAGVLDKRGITSIYIPDSVKVLPADAFSNHPLSAIRISQNPELTEIPASAFNCGVGTASEIELSPYITKVSQYGFAFLPLVKIKLGANVDIFYDATYPTMGAYGAGFKTLYDAGGKLAGTYEYSAGTWSKTA